ncbi:MAG: flagellar brake protein [Burkholderiaceae bacterium]
MRESPSSLVPVRAGEVVLGKPLPWSVYDAQGKLLLQRGHVIASATQLENLLEYGYYSDASWQMAAPALRPEPPPRAQKLVRVTPLRDSGPVPPPAMPETAVRMEDVRWHIGENLFLQVAENPRLRYTVPLIGYVRQQSILTGAPTVDGKLEFVREGQSFVIRAFAGKKAYAFSAAVVKSVLTPHPYLHLSYPKQIGCTVVRQDARAPVQIITALELGTPPRTLAATMVDLSIGGCSLSAAQALGAAGDEGRIKFKLCAAGHEEVLNLPAALRSVAPDAGGECRHGFSFGQLAPRERLILSAYVHQTLVDLD